MESNKKVISIVKEVVDPRGRYITPNEFRWLMGYFRDPLDPRRLALAIMYTCGIRLENAVRLKLSDFKDDFTYLHCRQNKPNVRCKDRILRVTVKNRQAYVPPWLSKLLKDFSQYRLYEGYYTKWGDGSRIFPSLTKTSIMSLFEKLRQRYGDEQPWLRDVWYTITKVYDDGTSTLHKYHRVNSHACRANYCLTALHLTGNSNDGRLLSGHADTRTFERYTRYSNIDRIRKQHCQTYMTPLLTTQKTPILKGQKTLTTY